LPVVETMLLEGALKSWPVCSLMCFLLKILSE
jgi:hypothetical protein